MSDLVVGVVAGQAMASLAAGAAWATAPDRLVSFAWRLARRERRPLSGEEWLEELDRRTAFGQSRRLSSLLLLVRAIRLRTFEAIHPRVLLRNRRRDTETGAVVVISMLDFAVEVSVAMNLGGPKDTWLMPPRAKALFESLPVGATGLFTVTRSPDAVRYADVAGCQDGRVAVRARRRWRFGWRRPAQGIILRPARSTRIV